MPSSCPLDLARFEQIDVRFSNGQETLAGAIVKPGDRSLCHSVVLVHGSGPETRSSGGATMAYRDHLVSHGYAVLSCDKPGAGESTGDWRRQTLEDRSAEVASAVRFMESQTFVHSRHVGLLGWSQAGWVMPIVTQLVESVAFIVSISGPAVTPLEQEMYRIQSQMRADRFSETEVSRALGAYSHVAEMAREGNTVERILDVLDAARRESWFDYLGVDTKEILTFLVANLWFNPLPYLRQLRCPFLGIWGELDTFVPVQKSMRLTRDALTAAGNARFELQSIPRANHRMQQSVTGSPNETGRILPVVLRCVSSWLSATLAR